MTKQEFHQHLYDSMIDRFRSLDENWSTFLDTPIKDIREGRILNDPAVIALAHAVEMLGLRIQYLQSTMTALAGGQIVQEETDVSLESVAGEVTATFF